ncbi:tetratricopeptide repeat protein [Lewinella sp. JB7]|uniref:tetratricopeptide repeat protein n=1 Tax=Lewinella sp. JB7 TaxID=2962887 RepID=UPI0020C97C1A|nr:tetratricopeptide repeat protein [Lewinella sp. JB7]MCP9234387.1 S41 family peptidase [Lewinella sp. JB7]
MRHTLLTLILLCASASATAQIDLTPAEWRQDLRFLQETVHTDYPFLFKKVSAEAFDAAVEKLHADLPALDDHEVIVGLARLVALFGYGHTNLWLTGWDPGNPYGFRQMPYNLYWFADGVYVQGAHRDYAEAVGARVTHVAGVPVEEALEAVRPVVSVENEQFFKASAVHYLGTPAVLHAQGVIDSLQGEITLTLAREGAPYEVSFAPASAPASPLRYGLIQEDDHWLDARDNTTTPAWLAELDRIYYYTYLADSKTVYVRQSQVEDDSGQGLSDFYAEVFRFVETNDVERLVLDVRLNGGGNNYKNKDVVRGIIRTEKIDQPGKLFVIIGRRTFSAAQNLVNELHHYTNAIFVGEPTAENVNFYGDNRPTELPNSHLRPRLSFAWWQDKPQWENDDWLAPHLAVGMTFADYRDNRDPALAAILRYDGEIDLTDPMHHLEELYKAGKLAEVRTEAHRLVQDPRYDYYPFERNFDRTGHLLLEQGAGEAAVMVFQLNAELFPNSPDVWNSLAEAYWKSGDTIRALEHYERAIALDPTGPAGERARAVRAKIRAGMQ